MNKPDIVYEQRFTAIIFEGKPFREGDMIKYKVVLEPQEDRGYTVYVPSLPGCVSQGETIDEAMSNIREAMEVYLESLKARGIPIPKIEEREVAV
jgi:predicted RNase H-like HicB family nuclease